MRSYRSWPLPSGSQYHLSWRVCHLFHQVRLYRSEEHYPLFPSCTITCAYVSKSSAHLRMQKLTLKNSPKHELYGLQGLPFAYLRSFVSQNRMTSSMRSSGSSELPMPTKALGASVGRVSIDREHPSLEIGQKAYLNTSSTQGWA